MVCLGLRISSRNAATAAGIDVLFDERLADAAGQDEGQRAAHDLLVLARWRPSARRSAAVRRECRASAVGRPDRRRDGAATRPVSWPGEPEPGRKAVRQHHADGDAFAVQQAVGVAGRRFERVAEGVAEIEQARGRRSRFSSASTKRALAAQARAIASARAGPPAKISAPVALPASRRTLRRRSGRI